ncbi:MAG: hypothetical protein IKF38_01465, partial [Clostridia bacterium]|nr:hypothetical protein [Clostridia bacterium]
MKNIKLNDLSYFLTDKHSDTINNEEDIKKYVKLNMKCVFKSYFGEKKEYSQEYIKNLLSINMESKNTTILFMDSGNEGNKISNLVDLAVSFTTHNKKVLIIVDGPKEYDLDDQFDIRDYIKPSPIKNIEIFKNPFEISLMNEVITQFKKLYDVIIVDTLSSKEINKNINFFSVIDYIVLLVNSGETKIKDFKKVYRTVLTNGEKPFGVVLNEEDKTQTYNLQIQPEIQKISNDVYETKLYVKQNKNILDLKKEIVELEKKLENEIINREENYKQKSELEQEIKVNNDNLIKMIKNNEDNNQMLIKENINKITQEIDNSKKEMDSIVLSMQEENTKKQNEAKKEFDRVTQIIEALKDEMKQENEKLQEEMKKEIEKAKEKARQEIEQIQEENIKTQEELKQETENNLNKKITEENTKIQDEIMQKVESFNEANVRIQEEMKQELENRNAEAKQENQKQIEEVKQEIEKQKQEVIEENQKQREEAKQ